MKSMNFGLIKSLCAFLCSAIALSVFAGLSNTAQAQANTVKIISDLGVCLDVQGARTENGTPIVVYQCHDGANQKFDLVKDSNGYNTLRFAGKCVDAAASQGLFNRFIAVGARLVLWDCNNQVNQVWVTNGKQLRGANNFCVDIVEGNPSKGVVVWNCGEQGQPNQSWTLQTVSAAAPVATPAPAASPPAAPRYGLDLSKLRAMMERLGLNNTSAMNTSELNNTSALIFLDGYGLTVTNEVPKETTFVNADNFTMPMGNNFTMPMGNNFSTQAIPQNKIGVAYVRGGGRPVMCLTRPDPRNTTYAYLTPVINGRETCRENPDRSIVIFSNGLLRWVDPKTGPTNICFSIGMNSQVDPSSGYKGPIGYAFWTDCKLAVRWEPNRFHPDAISVVGWHDWILTSFQVPFKAGDRINYALSHMLYPARRGAPGADVMTWWLFPMPVTDLNKR